MISTSFQSSSSIPSTSFRTRESECSKLSGSRSSVSFDAVQRPLRVQILLDPFAEILDRNRKVVLGALDPTDARRLTLSQRFAERLDDLVLIEFVRVALRDP